MRTVLKHSQLTQYIHFDIETSDGFNADALIFAIVTSLNQREMYRYEIIIMAAFVTTSIHIIHRLCRGDMYIAITGILFVMTVAKYACSGLQPMLILGTYLSPFFLALDASILYSFLLCV